MSKLFFFTAYVPKHLLLSVSVLFADLGREMVVDIVSKKGQKERDGLLLVVFVNI